MKNPKKHKSKNISGKPKSKKRRRPKNFSVKDKYKVKLSKLEEIYKNYLVQYSRLTEKRNTIFNKFLKALEHKKIENLRKNIKL